MITINFGKIVYKDDLLSIVAEKLKLMNDIKLKYGEDDLVNKGLFLMTTSYFEATMRDLLFALLNADPSKLKKEKFYVSRDEMFANGNDLIIKSVIDKELYSLFQGNVKNQLLYLTELVTNIKQTNIAKKAKRSNLSVIIAKTTDVALYRNALIHDRGRKQKDFDKTVMEFKSYDSLYLNYSKERLIDFAEAYISYYEILIEKISKNSNFPKRTRINQIINLWLDIMDSPMLGFDDYWEYDVEKDIVTAIKFPKHEDYLSSTEKIYLSIWRHQYYDAIPTREFLLCSVDMDKIHTTYNILEQVGFCYMSQEAGYLL